MTQDGLLEFSRIYLKKTVKIRAVRPESNRKMCVGTFFFASSDRDILK